MPRPGDAGSLPFPRSAAGISESSSRKSTGRGIGNRRKRRVANAASGGPITQDNTRRHFRGASDNGWPCLPAPCTCEFHLQLLDPSLAGGPTRQTDCDLVIADEI